ncbi:MAG: methytransferase partner Trm112 [Methanosarcinaceae archaeon]|nr:methytransferase partner Trm112 [Methanosarcinaceae archaeon]
MKKNMPGRMVCPVCKGKLSVRAEKENEDEILSGNLFCPACAVYYPVVDGIPNMLPPDMRYSF